MNAEIEIDMETNIGIGIDNYIELVKQSTDKIGNLYKIFLKIKDIKYTCYVFISIKLIKAITYFLKTDATPTDFNSINIGALNGNMVFMVLESDGTGELKTRGIDFETIELNGKKNKLDTIFYLRTFFYRMLNVKTICISDEAMFLCKDAPSKEYNALMYRIFATDKPLNDVCIYQRYFYRITREGDLSESALEKMLKNYRTRYSKKFTDFDANCAIRADELDLLYTETDEEFEKLYDSLSSFSALTKDSIYWPKDKKSKSRKKSKNAKKSR